MGRIYTVGVSLTYDIYEPKILWLKEKFLTIDSQIQWKKPVFAESKQDAIEKFTKRYDIPKCKIVSWDANHDRYATMEYHNIEREVIVIYTTNNYTFDQLKAEMNSQDFMEYCRQELIGVNEIIK